MDHDVPAVNSKKQIKSLSSYWTLQVGNLLPTLLCLSICFSLLSPSINSSGFSCSSHVTPPPPHINICIISLYLPYHKQKSSHTHTHTLWFSAHTKAPHGLANCHHVLHPTENVDVFILHTTRYFIACSHT